MDFPYNLDKPSKEYKLPNKYIETSGIWPLEGSNSVAFVQDEAIRVYELDLESEEVIKHEKHGSGDSEDIVVIGSTAYLLHAGNEPSIYKISDYDKDKSKSQCFDLDLDKKYDPEGLAHDARNNRLLIACKGSPEKNDPKRAVYAFDLNSETRSDSAVFVIDSRDFLKKDDESFNPAGIAIHHQTNDVYIVGTKGEKMIVCYSQEGRFKDAWKLDKDEFAQPEGIAFTESGDLIISSEGIKGKKSTKARVYVFQRQT